MNLTIEDYNDKSFAVYGNISSYKDDLIRLGGTENSYLNRKSTGKRCTGIIFPNYKRQAVTEFCNGGEEKEPVQKAPVKPPIKAVSSSSSSSLISSTKDPVWSMMLSRIENLEAEVNCLKQIISKTSSTQTVKPVSTLRETKTQPLVESISQDSDDEDSESKQDERPSTAPTTGRLLRRPT